MGVVASRFDVFLVNLGPPLGHQIKKTRPCLIISPDEMNKHIETIIVAPMTTKGCSYPSRVPINVQGKKGQIVLDHIRTIDKSRLTGKLGRIDKRTAHLSLSLGKARCGH